MTVAAARATRGADRVPGPAGCPRRAAGSAGGTRPKPTDCPVPELEDCRAWREMSERLAANGNALLEDLGERAGEAGPKIAGRLDSLAEILLVDDGVVRVRGVPCGRCASGRRRPIRSRTMPTVTTVLLELARALAPHRIVPVAREECGRGGHRRGRRPARNDAMRKSWRSAHEAAELWDRRARLESLARATGLRRCWRAGPPGRSDVGQPRNAGMRCEGDPDTWRPHLKVAPRTDSGVRQPQSCWTNLDEAERA